VCRVRWGIYSKTLASADMSLSSSVHQARVSDVSRKPCRQQAGEAGCRAPAQPPSQSSQHSSGQRPQTSTGIWPSPIPSGGHTGIPAHVAVTLSSCPMSQLPPRAYTTLGRQVDCPPLAHAERAITTMVGFQPRCATRLCVDPGRDTKTGDAPRHWRWRGFLTDYYTAELPEGALCETCTAILTAQPPRFISML